MTNIRTVGKSGFILRDGKQRRETVWIGSTETSTAIAGGGVATLLLVLNAAALALRPFTVVRSRGIAHFATDQTTATESQSLAFGDCVVSDQASAIGVTAVPTPVTDDGSDLWLLYERMRGNILVATNVSIAAPGGLFMKFDSKAMRKVDIGQDLITVVESAASTSGMTFQHYVRTLVKLH